MTLAIEISNPTAAGPGCGVALTAGGEGGWVDQELLKPMRPGARGGHDDDLMPAIDRLFVRRGVAPRGVGTVVVSIGPGGFTGLRVACAAAKMIAAAADGGGAQCVAVPTALVAAHAMRDALARGGPMVVTLAAKGETAWAQAFECGGGNAGIIARGSGGLIAASDLAGLWEGGVRILAGDRFLPRSMREEAERLGMAIVEPELSATACLEASRGLPRIDPVELVPLYPREPDAVTLWRTRKGAARAEPGSSG